jgi:pyruvate kinase
MPTDAQRRTKIIATLGPATESPEMLARLITAGVNVFRLNMSHAPHDWVRRVVKDIRAAAASAGHFVGILMDTQGPAIRTGDLPVPLDLQPGQKFTLTVRGERSEEEHSVDVNYENFVNDISVGDVVLLDNGAIHMKVLAKRGKQVECEVLTEGKLGSRRHINLPGVKVSLPALTTKDIADVKLGLELAVDFIALSFVREARDLIQLRQLFTEDESTPLVIAKIEDQQAVKNLEEIVAVADGVMIARGDLGIEIPYEELPIVQRRIVKTCLRVGKPVIVATHMLESMIESPMPTRAEVTDVANAVFEQADAIMLSGETTVGIYPLKCIEVFDRIARRFERSGGARFEEAADLSTARQKMV